jgi:hypothetical protein
VRYHYFYYFLTLKKVSSHAFINILPIFGVYYNTLAARSPQVKYHEKHNSVTQYGQLADSVNRDDGMSCRNIYCVFFFFLSNIVRCIFVFLSRMNNSNSFHQRDNEIEPSNRIKGSIEKGR